MNSNTPTQTKPEKLLRLPEVEALTGLKKTSLYNGAHDGTFPKPIRISARCVAWRESDLLAWQAQRQHAPIGAKKKAAKQ
jgi:prophage regulatory protein